MLKRPVWPRGTVHSLTLDSVVLRGNPLGDPSVRELQVYTPPGYDPSRRYPLLVDLVGYTGSGRSHTNWRAFGDSVPERADRLIARGELPPVVIAFPDCFTAWGGNQYLDSAATGPYLTHLCEEVVPFVEARFAAGGSRERRGVFGKSSGGYGALVQAAFRPDVWGAAVCHSGDAGFEYCYLPHFPLALATLERFERDPRRFLDAVWAKEKLTADEVDALMTLGMAAHYDPDPQAPLGLRLPFDLETGAIDPERWAAWLDWDPVRFVPRRLDALRGLRGLWVDCGRKDEYHLLWGARQVHRALTDGGVPHVYEEFDDDHRDIDYRMDRSLPFLARALG